MPFRGGNNVLELICRCPECNSTDVETLGFRLRSADARLFCCNACGTPFWRYTDQQDVPTCQCGALATDIDGDTGEYRCGECGRLFSSFCYALPVPEEEMARMGLSSQAIP